MNIKVIYLTTTELSQRIKLDMKTIYHTLKNGVLIHPFSGKKFLLVWGRSQECLMKKTQAVHQVSMLVGGEE